uniref:ABC transmembrane type-1 domain-containing protein n=1 Tax=Heterorhabditis bacteriophora TaxID=37862 RepID=A0A1I7WTE1_HETBA
MYNIYNNWSYTNPIKKSSVGLEKFLSTLGFYLPLGDYAFLLWNFLAAFLLDFSWKVYFSHPPSSYIILDEDKDEDEEIAPKQTFELIFRLLQYCKKEWIWHISGFSWLFIYSISMWHLKNNIYIYIKNVLLRRGRISSYSRLSNNVRYRSSQCQCISQLVYISLVISSDMFQLLSERTQNAIAESNDVAEEVTIILADSYLVIESLKVLSTMRTVRSFACENVEGDRFYVKLTKTLNVTKTKAFAYIGFIWVSELFQTFIIVAVLWYGGHLVLAGKMKADLLVSFLLYQMQLGDNLRQMGEVWTGLMQSVGASRKVFEYIDREPAILHYGTSQPVILKGKIEFRNVHFSYPTRSNLPILKASYIALVGQEPILFARSVTENIRYGVDVTETVSY